MSTVATFCLCLAFLVPPAGAQPGGFQRPIAGFVFNSGSRAIRPLIGVPGATYLGDAAVKDLNTAWIAPGGNWAFVTTPTHSAFVRGLSEPVPGESAAEGLIEDVDRVAWSRDGSFAVLYSSSGGRMQRVHLADGQVSVDGAVDLTPWGALTDLAIDPSGRQIAFGITGAGIYMMDGPQSPSLLVSMTRPAATAFSDSGRLYAVDADSRRIIEFGPDSSPAEFAIANAVDGTEFEPLGLAISGTGTHLLLTDRGTRTVSVYEIATRTLANTLQLDLAPTQMQRLSTGATFLLSRPGGKDWMLVLDATDIPHVYFVPAGEEEAR